VKPLQLNIGITLDSETVTALVEFMREAVRSRPENQTSNPIVEQRKMTPMEASQNALFRGQKPPENLGLLVDTRELSKMLKVSDRTIWAMQMDVFERGFDFTTAVVLFIEDRVIGDSLLKLPIRPARIGDFTVAEDSDAEAVDMTDQPMAVALQNHVGIVRLTEGSKRCLDDGGIGFVEQATVPVMGVENGPVVRVGDLIPAMPDEGVEVSPVSSGLLGCFLDCQFTERSGHAISPC
jgi:hypothetical protein